MASPEGNGRLEVTKFHSPSIHGDNRNAPANTTSIRNVAFAAEDIDAFVAGLRARGTELVGELERYADRYRLCYVRSPEGIIMSSRRRSANGPNGFPALCDLSRGSDSPAEALSPIQLTVQPDGWRHV